jgi:hypothetical protein
MHSLCLLAKVTVLNNESHKGFQELLRQHILRIAPRAAVEATCSAIQSSPGDLECLAHACGVLAGKNPRIQAPRQPGERKITKRTQGGSPRLSRPLGRMAARTVRRSVYPWASGHTSRSRGLQPVNPKNLRLRHSRGTAASSGRCVPGNTPGRNGGGGCVRTYRPVPRVYSHVLSTGHHKSARCSPAAANPPGQCRFPCVRVLPGYSREVRIGRPDSCPGTLKLLS